MHRKLLLMIAFLIIFLLAGCQNTMESDNQSNVVDGKLDLTTKQINMNVISLDGKWEFYWNQLLVPEDFGNVEDESTEYIEVPGSWNKYITNDKELSGNGYATFRLYVKTEDAKRLGLKIPRIFTAYKLWINGELLASTGTVGTGKEAMSPQYLPQAAFFTSLRGENEIVIQVSNYHHRSGGILESIVLGSEKMILDMRYKKIAYEFLLFGCLMIMGLYHIILFSYRTKNTSPLYFGLFCLFLGIRTLVVGERMFIYLFPDFSWELAHKIQTMAFYLGLPTIVTFFMTVFPLSFHRKAVRIIQITGIAFGLLVLLTPARIFTVFNPGYQIFAFCVIVYLIIGFIRALFRKEKGIRLTIAGGMALVLTSLNDIIFLSIWMNDNHTPLLRSIIKTGSLSSFGQLVFIFANSLILAKRFSGSLEHEEVITKQLKEINQDLDVLVRKRTEDLEEAKRKIEDQKWELEKANDILQVISLKDPLTGLWNRRHYDDAIKAEWNRSLRHKRHIAFMIIDIDYFKEFNDCYGHMAGDKCLVTFAQAIKSLFKRSGDLTVRYGGEEFVIVLPETEREDAIKMADLVLKTIEDLNIPHESSLVSPRVTISIGVSSIVPSFDDSIELLLQTADKALYQAKNSGRNQLVYLPCNIDSKVFKESADTIT